MKYSALIMAALLAFLSGCAHYQRNAPLVSVNSQAGYRFQNVSPTNSPDLLLMLAFSGGGTRAAALSYGILEELARTPVTTEGHQHRLLDEVDIISSVSGGSFTAAYYALWGDRIFSDFESQFLKKDIQDDLLFRMMTPWNQARLASIRFSRTDLAAEYYDRLLFKGATFSDLTNQTSRPFLIINSTDISLGTRFEFTQDQFDLLHSDLSKFPVSRAVAASSAFPLVLSPIVIRNYSPDFPHSEPQWIRSALSSRASSSRLRNLALQERSYVDGEPRRYVQLLDGGIADNLGLRGAVDRAVVYQGPNQTLPGVALQRARRIAFIIVDAHTEPETHPAWTIKDKVPGLGDVLESVGAIAVNRYSFETIELFRETMTHLHREAAANGLQAASDSQDGLEVYIIELHFSQLANDADRHFFNSVPTSFRLSSKTVDRLCQLAARQLAGNDEFQRLLSDLANQPHKSNLPDRPSLVTTTAQKPAIN